MTYLTRKKSITKAVLPLILILLVPAIPGLLLKAEAMLIAGAPKEESVLGPQADLSQENTLKLRDDQAKQGWEKRFFGEPLFQEDASQKKTLQWKSGPNLSLKSPGMLPGIELGVEMHSFQALQSVMPPENLPKGLDLKQEQPLLLPPSVNAPDYNGGFLRFTW